MRDSSLFYLLSVFFFSYSAFPSENHLLESVFVKDSHNDFLAYARCRHFSPFLLKSPIKEMRLGPGDSRMLSRQPQPWCFITLSIYCFGLWVCCSLFCQINSAHEEDGFYLFIFIHNPVGRLFRSEQKAQLWSFSFLCGYIFLISIIKTYYYDGKVLF